MSGRAASGAVAPDEGGSGKTRPSGMADRASEKTVVSVAATNVARPLDGAPVENDASKGVERVRAALLKMAQTSRVPDVRAKVPELQGQVRLVNYHGARPEDTMYGFGSSWQFSLVLMEWNVDVAPAGFSEHMLYGRFEVDSSGEYRAIQTDEAFGGGRGNVP